MKIRKAQIKDIGRIIELLSQVLELHAKLRPDIFVSGTTKYTEKELKDILQNPKTPVFVAVNETDYVMGYAFTVIQRQPFTTNMKNFKTLYIDDI